MKKIYSQKYRAFTLIELLLVMAIIGIMSAVLFASLTSNKSASRLKAAQREVASTIKLAQTYALQGNKQNGVTPCGYGFRFTSSTSYEIIYNIAGNPPTNYADCEDRNSQQQGRHWIGGGGPNASPPAAETYSLKNGVTLCTGGSCGNLNSKEIYFTVPHANAFDNGGNIFGSNLDFTLDLSGVRETVTFNAGGSVSESQ